MSLRSVTLLAALLSIIPLVLTAQEAAAPIDAPITVEAPAATPAVATPSPSVPQPRPSPLFQVDDPAPDLNSLDNASTAAAGSSHKIVVSTLVLVLIVVILVLLIT